LVISYGIFGYWHAKRRVARGLPPLAYHRVCSLFEYPPFRTNTLQWLLSRRQRAQFDPRYRDAVPGDSYSSDQYGMHAYPPPVYDPNSAPPPKYQPPEGASKVDPTQRRAEASSTPVAAGEPSPAYAPPPGPPPSALHANQTGSSSTSNNPFRQ
jgi:hypothetical protein